MNNEKFIQKATQAVFRRYQMKLRPESALYLLELNSNILRSNGKINQRSLIRLLTIFEKENSFELFNLKETVRKLY